MPSTSPLPDFSPLTHPVAIDDDVVYVATNGDLVLWRNEDVLSRLPVDALPDARMAVNGDGLIALYIAATGRYPHGIMGDETEGSTVAAFQILDDELHYFMRVDLSGGEVYEGIMPFWADVNGDGQDDLVTTISDSDNGAHIHIYLLEGTGIREIRGPAIGRGYRWRHQLAWGAFGPEGEMELVDVLTPHIGGVVEFYQYDGDALNIVASLPGYTSHVIGSRNLDMAVAGDFNGDGQLEIVLPNQERTRIAGIQHMAEGAQEVWSLPLDGTLVTNLAAVTLPDGNLALAAGTDDGRLRVWMPE